MNDKKKLFLRIIMLILAGLMIIGVVVSSFSAFQASAETAGLQSVTVKDFTTGSLRSAIESAKGSIDQNNIQKLEVLSGTLNSTDIQALQMLSNCKEIYLDKTTLEDGNFSDNILSGRGSLTKFTLPQGTKRIGDGAFSGCGKLTEIVFPDSVTEIGNRAFEGCTGIQKINLPKGVTSIAECAFRGSGLTEITLNSSAAPTIGSEAFPKTANVITADGATGYDDGGWKDYNVKGGAKAVTLNAGKVTEISKNKDTAKTTETTKTDDDKATDEETTEETTQVDSNETDETMQAVDIVKEKSTPTWKIAVTIIVCVFAAIGLSSILLFLFKKIDIKKK